MTSWVGMSERRVAGQPPKDFEQRLLLGVDATPPPTYRGTMDFNHVFGDQLRRQQSHEPKRGEVHPILVDAMAPGCEELTTQHFVARRHDVVEGYAPTPIGRRRFKVFS